MSRATWPSGAARLAARALSAGVVVLLATTAASSYARSLDRLGAIGDSLTDEYAEESYDYARSWTELLAEQRGVDFGPSAAEAGQPGASWGEPRRSGFEDNWARFGDTTADAIQNAQDVGVADGARTRGVSHVVILVGGNDFSPWSGAYDEIYDGIWSDAQIDAWIDGRIANFTSMLNVVEPTGAQIVIANVLDFSAMPLISQGGFPDADRRDRVADALTRLSQRVRQLAAERRLIFVDAFALGKAIFGSNQNPRRILRVGNVSIDTSQADTVAGTSPTSAWVHDGVHPNTIIQGIIANVVAMALSLDDDVAIPAFSEAEILANAGLSYGGQDTLSDQIGSLSDYIADLRSEIVFTNGFE